MATAAPAPLPVGNALPFTVVHASSEDEPHPASELAGRAASAARGWRSAKRASAPHEIVFRFDGEAQVSQLQILAHECIIPTRVDVWVASLDGCDLDNPPAWSELPFARLGFFTFISNEKSKYRSRERKTVNLSASAYMVKLVLHKAHVNPLNAFHQVSLMRVDCFGDMKAIATNHRPPQLPSMLAFMNAGKADGPHLPAVGSGGGGGGARSHNVASPRPAEAENGGSFLPPLGSGNMRQQQQVQQAQPQHQVQLPPIYNQGQAQAGPSSVGFRSQPILEFEHYYLRRSRELALRKAQAAEAEDFVAANAHKTELASLQALAERVYDAEAVKIRAVLDENFDAAKAAKTRMDRLLEAAYALQRSADAAAEGAGVGNGPVQPQAQQQRQPAGARERAAAARAAAAAAAAAQAHGDGEDETSDPDDAAALSGSPQRGRGGFGGGGVQHAFDEQPVQSKYAVMMAEQAAKNKLRSSTDGNNAEGQQTPAASGVTSPDIPEHQHQDPPPPAERKKGLPRKRADAARSIANEADSAEDNPPEEEDEQQDEDQQGDPASDVTGDKPRNQRKSAPPSASPSRRNSQAASNNNAESADGASGGTTAANGDPAAFRLENFPEWERDVYFAICDEMGDNGAQEAMAEPVDSSEFTQAPEMASMLGTYTTACLLSKRWRLRDAALRVLSKFLPHLYRNVSITQSVTSVLRYLDLKGYGLLDPILVVFVSACDFVVRLIEGKFDGCPLSAVQTHVVNLMPRLVIRAGDVTQKSRDEALALVLCFAACPTIGAERVAMGVLADPVDADKRRVGPQSARLHVSRLMILRQLICTHGLLASTAPPSGAAGNGNSNSASHRGPTVDMIMNRLLLPCLNNAHADVREQALGIVGLFTDSLHGQVVGRYVHMIHNPSTQTAVQERLALPQSTVNAATKDVASGENSVPPPQGAKRRPGKPAAPAGSGAVAAAAALPSATAAS